MPRKKMDIRQQQIGRMQMRIKYTKLPEDVKKAIVSMPYIVEETVKLTWDGRQFILRIPKEIAEEVGIEITDGNMADSPEFIPLVDKIVNDGFTIDEVSGIKHTIL